MVGAVHGLQHVLFALLRSGDGPERVFAVVGVVAAGYIETLTADVWRDDFLISIALLYLTQVILKAKTQVGTLW